METIIFTCKYFKFGSNTTGLSQSHFRNFLACSITREITATILKAFYLIINCSVGKWYLLGVKESSNPVQDWPRIGIKFKEIPTRTYPSFLFCILLIGFPELNWALSNNNRKS